MSVFGRLTYLKHTQTCCHGVLLRWRICVSHRKKNTQKITIRQNKKHKSSEDKLLLRSELCWSLMLDRNERLESPPHFGLVIKRLCSWNKTAKKYEMEPGSRKSEWSTANRTTKPWMFFTDGWRRFCIDAPVLTGCCLWGQKGQLEVNHKPDCTLI